MRESGEKAGKSETAKREEEVLAFWQENKIFEKSEQKDSPKGEFVFYDGPPFATGLPHYGHILAGTIKDAIPRYKTMRGFRVRRKWGWDCHGLPLENEIEKELGLKSKKDIEELGVGKFNQAAKKAVLRYADDWRRIVPRMGRFVDMERDYKTMDVGYTESVWWIFKTLYEKGLIYEGFKSMHLCPRCGTTLSNFEVAQGYKDITDFAVTVKLELKDEPDTYLLVWTTTPWTLPGNMAAAVHKDAKYVKVKKDGEHLILAKERVSELGEEYEIVEELEGEQLVGKAYTPPFHYFTKKNIEGSLNAWKIYHASYVSFEEGTGAVHLAPAFGAEDMELAKENDIPLVHHVGVDGRFIDEVKDFRGQSAKPKDTKEEPHKHQEADIEIIKYLAQHNLLFKKEKIVHSYPLCWRCDTPLLNYAASSWFVNVRLFKDKLVSENKKVHWVPKEVGEKRFGHWLENARDWAISRARYWGAPLPVWKNPKNKKVFVMGSVEDLKRYTPATKNSYHIMRHGEALSNTKGILNSALETKNPLTNKGEEEVVKTAQAFSGKKIDYIFHSPLQRTKETARILMKELLIPEEQIKEDKRLLEVQFGEFEGGSIEDYHSFFAFAHERLTKLPEGGETWNNVKQRTGEFLYELESTYKGKNILIISHNGTLQMLQAAAQGLDVDHCADRIADNVLDLLTGEAQELPFTKLPHNEFYELDLHRPYIDEVELFDGETKLERVPDVFDCWFESGSMPYGQFHYPFENTDLFEPTEGFFKKAKGYPADFIAEGLDQTRGWFYSLIVLGTALFGKSPYKNVIVNGLVLAEDGAKMSKRLKNYPDPIDVVLKYGADSLRYYLLSSPIVRGEDLNFSEKGVEEIMRKNVGRLENVLSFYKLYEKEVVGVASVHILDRWIMARLYELSSIVTTHMDRYELDRAARPIADFIDDLSTWYLRRSRDRFKGDDSEDKQRALHTTRFVLEDLSKIIAPFMPFFSEYLFQAVDKENNESVHLESWPEAQRVDQKLLDQMKKVRTVVSRALEVRASAGIKVRQPLGELKIKNQELNQEFLELIKDEVNVKEVVVDTSLEDAVQLDTNLTQELKDEGVMRDFMRHVQEMRKKDKLTPADRIELIINTDNTGESILTRFEEEIRRTVLADLLVFGDNSGETLTLDGRSYTISLNPLIPKS